MQAQTHETSIRQLVLVVFLALLFTIGLTWASVELPRLLANSFAETIPLPGYDPATDPSGMETVMRTDLVRAVGYTSFLAVLVLATIGLWTGRKRMASVGALGALLPVFGHFVPGMSFLAGLAVFRVIWLPLIETSIDLLRLGDVAYLPYMAAVYFPALVGLDIRSWLGWALMGIGMFVFVLGTAAWLTNRLRGDSTADFLVYRMSRHPQYLGWILWSYGLLIFFLHHSALFRTRVRFGMPNTLPWVVSTMVIIGVALLEEIRMRRAHVAEYEQYARRTPFLLPLPGWTIRFISLPMRLVLGKERPEKPRDVVAVVALYLLLLVVLSLPFVLLQWPPTGWEPGTYPWGSGSAWYAWRVFPYNVFPFE